MLYNEHIHVLYVTKLLNLTIQVCILNIGIITLIKNFIMYSLHDNIIHVHVYIYIILYYIISRQ